MTPKEQAKEIYCKMELNLKSHRKKCSLNAVDLVISELPKLLPYGMQYLNKISYWEEVKEELEKL